LPGTALAECGFLLKITLAAAFPKREDLPSRALNWKYPASPTPSESLAGRWFCKNGLQNIDVK
jgi:hypothetical protein